MDRKEMVNFIYNNLRIRSELVSRELWKDIAELSDDEVKEQYNMMQTAEVKDDNKEM